MQLQRFVCHRTVQIDLFQSILQLRPVFLGGSWRDEVRRIYADWDVNGCPLITATIRNGSSKATGRGPTAFLPSRSIGAGEYGWCGRAPAIHLPAISVVALISDSAASHLPTFFRVPLRFPEAGVVPRVGIGNT